MMAGLLGEEFDQDPLAYLSQVPGLLNKPQGLLDTTPGSLMPIAPVAGHTTIPINRLLRSTDRLALAKSDIAKGEGSRSQGKPVQVSMSPDGHPLVVDGYHRIVEAEMDGKSSIAVEYVPWTDTFGRVVAKEAGRWIGPN